MRIRINLAIEVDPDAWASEYHLGDANGNYRNKDVVNDVRTYVQNAVSSMMSRTDENVTVEIVR